MGTDQIMYCVVALILGMLLANMLKNVCGCKTVVEGALDWGALGGALEPPNIFRDLQDGASPKTMVEHEAEATGLALAFTYPSKFVGDE
jgi:hypothetical protein